MKYRREIDGLRAIAVLPVVLFHAGVDAFSGGFVGVDIFFVISGYLITGILIGELEKGDFSIVRFYERRARRILPALFFVMLCCIPFAWMWLQTAQLSGFSKSLIAVVFFCSNILFWRGQGYFAPEAELEPLLHTWSLAVEEQYYVVFPVGLLLLWRFGRNPAFWAVVAAAVASFALSEWAWRHYSSGNFYLAPTRAWELLAGSICAFLLSKRPIAARGWVAMIGFGAIIGSILLFERATPTPSFYALAPVGGAVLIILFGGSGTMVARLLSTRLLVGIGLISYSAYLWHQPLFTFARIRSIVEPSPVLMAGLVVATFILAYFSWRFVEQPFRAKGQNSTFSRKQIFVSSAVVGAIIVAIGAYGIAHSGFRTPIYKSTGVAKNDVRIALNFGLHQDCAEGFTLSANCQTRSEPELLLWGDSYSMHLARGFVASDPALAMRQHSKSNCAPILGMALTKPDFNDEWAESCIAFNDQVFAWLKNNPSVRYVALSSEFQMLNEALYDRSGQVASHGGAEQPNLPRVKAELLKTVTAIRKTGRKVILVSPTPQTGADIGQCLLRSLYFAGAEDICDFPQSKVSNQAAFALMDQIAPTVPVLRLDKMICAKGQCDTIQDGRLIYRDDDHLSMEGTVYLGKKYRWAELVKNTSN